MCANVLCQKTLGYDKRSERLHAFPPTQYGEGRCGVRLLRYRVLHDDGGVCDAS